VGRENLGLPDGGLEVTTAMTLPVAAAIRRWRPRLVVAPCPIDLHPDHTAAAELVKRAYYLATIGKVDAGGLPAHRADALIHYYGHKEPEPSFVVDVTDVWAEKLELVRCYASQLGLDGAGGPVTNIASPDFLRRYELRFAYWARASARASASRSSSSARCPWTTRSSPSANATEPCDEGSQETLSGTSGLLVEFRAARRSPWCRAVDTIGSPPLDVPFHVLT
jgi:hypothetical protein